MTTEVEEILAKARARGNRRAAASPKPDYKASQPIFTRQKAALTRAIKSGETEKIVLACTKAVREWAEPPFDGAWRDDWSRWQRALDDTLGFTSPIRLEDLA